MTAATQSDSNEHIPGKTQPILVPQNPAPAQQPDPPAPGKASLSTVTMTVPRLVSVVEIIKREYSKTLETKHSSKLSGLHQYNEIGCLEDLGLDECMDTQEENGKITLEMTLEGKNQYVFYPNYYINRSFYPTTTKSKAETDTIREDHAKSVCAAGVGRKGCDVSHLLERLSNRNDKTFRYQPPAMRKLSKSARARAKKRENNVKEADEINVIKPA